MYPLTILFNTQSVRHFRRWSAVCSSLKIRDNGSRLKRYSSNSNLTVARSTAVVAASARSGQFEAILIAPFTKASVEGEVSAVTAPTFDICTTNGPRYHSCSIPSGARVGGRSIPHGCAILGRSQNWTILFGLFWSPRHSIDGVDTRKLPGLHALGSSHPSTAHTHG